MTELTQQQMVGLKLYARLKENQLDYYCPMLPFWEWYWSWCVESRLVYDRIISPLQEESLNDYKKQLQFELWQEGDFSIPPFMDWYIDWCFEKGLFHGPYELVKGKWRDGVAIR